MSINRHLHKKTCRARSCGRRITYAEPRRIGHTLAFQYSTYIVPLRCALDHNFRLLLYHMQRPARGWHAHPSYFCFSMSNTGKKKIALQFLQHVCFLEKAIYFTVWSGSYHNLTHNVDTAAPSIMWPTLQYCSLIA